MSYGEDAVGIDFNPSFNPDVGKIKRLYAEIIDHLHAVRLITPPGEQARLCSVAITEAQGACMWAVKSIIFGKD